MGNQQTDPAGPACGEVDGNLGYTKNFDDVLITEHLQIAARRDFLKLSGGRQLRERAEAAESQRGPARKNWQEKFGNWLKLPKSSKTEEPRDALPDYSASGVHDTLGLALSGGGIRSAAFCLGAMQALSVKGILQRFDYVSSVSGGGYSSIAATLAESHNGGTFPFAGKKDDIKDTDDLRTLRNNANYLRFGKFFSMLKNLAIVCKGMAANIILTVAILLLLAAFSLWGNPTVLSLDVSGFDGLEATKGNLLALGPFRQMWFGISVLVLMAGFGISIWWAARAGLWGAIENFKGGLLILSSVWLLITAAAVFMELQPVLVKQMISARELKVADGIEYCLRPLSKGDTAKQQGYEAQVRCRNLAEAAVTEQVRLEALRAERASAKPDDAKPEAQTSAAAQESSGFKRLVEWLQALLAPALAFTALASRYVGDLLKSGSEGEGWGPTIKLLTGRSIVWAAGLALPVVLWVAYLGLFYWGVVVVNDGTATALFAPAFLAKVLAVPPFQSGPYVFTCFYTFIALVLILVWLMASVQFPNANSLHGLYRGRLGNAFCAPWANSDKNEMKLSALNPRHAPLHLINAALNVQASVEINQRGRNADFFTFSSAYVGSAATGFAATSRYEAMERNLDVASTMAISGAAASANMGSQSIRPLTFTLALLNIRLGVWLRNPMAVAGRRWSRDPFYFFDELMGRLKEDRSMVYLTDGGHIENLGIYELLRRRCRLIVAVDAEADRELNFTSLIALQRYARIDLGCRIQLPWQLIRKQSLAIQQGIRGQAAKAAGPDNAVKPADGPHCALGVIDYEGGGKGLLLYIKSSLSGDENDYIRDYNRRNFDFPHETTGDQNFSEEQFEVYRALGFHNTYGVVSGKHSVQVSDDKLAKISSNAGAPAIVKEFRKILRLG